VEPVIPEARLGGPIPAQGLPAVILAGLSAGSVAGRRSDGSVECRRSAGSVAGPG